MKESAEEQECYPRHVLFTSDLDRSRFFYGNILGFRILPELDCLKIRMSGCELVIFPTQEEDLPSDLGAILQLANIREMHYMLFKRRIEAVGELTPNPLGLMHFTLSDPDGNALYFVEKPN